MKNTINTLLSMKENGEKISQVTCYDYSMARIVDAAEVNTILVGDSLGMTMQGYSDTLPVTMDEMVVYGRSVVRGAPNAFVIMDMPFMSYQVSTQQAVESAGRLIKETGANAVKLEGGAAVESQIRAIVDCGIPVCAHIGMTPQSANMFGGFKVQGKAVDTAKQLVEDALEVQEAGAFSVVLEGIPAKLGAFITEQLDIPTIGIGAGNGCDGQVLVCQDLLDMFGTFVPKFVKQFAHIGDAIVDAYGEYIKEVKSGEFPAPENTYKIDDDVMAEVVEQVKRG